MGYKDGQESRAVCQMEGTSGLIFNEWKCFGKNSRNGNKLSNFISVNHWLETQVYNNFTFFIINSIRIRETLMKKFEYEN